jgi:hypothetical protein
VGASYTIWVSNAGQFSITSGVTVVDQLPAGFTATAISGSGWTCTLASLTCTRADSLAQGATYPNITITVNIPASYSGNAVDAATASYVSNLDSAVTTGTSTVAVRTPTPVNLTSSPNPSMLGQPVTLTASVKPGVTGQVSFYDGINPLGIATITAGHAILTTDLLASGSHSLTAEYSGDANYTPGVSPVQIQTVTALANTGFAPSTSDYTVTGLVSLFSSDLNGDGIPDLVTTNSTYPNSSISVLLGRGDGTFGPAVTYSLKNSPNSLAIGDFNQDGIPDLAASAGGIGIFLGNGDGTFRAPVSDGGVAVAGLVTADVNRDGILDLIGFSEGLNSPIIVFLGNGDGTFQAGVGTPTSVQAWTIVDLNGDGVPDVVGITAAYATPVLAYLGNTNGTFQAALTSPGPANQYAVALSTGDFNGDGKPDVAIVYWNGVAFLAGNGDGTFQAPVMSALTGGVPGSPAVAADFDGDGKLDLGIRAYAVNTLLIASGNGDGTFQSGATLSTDGYGGNAVVGDFNRDGRPDVAVANQSTGTVNVFLGSKPLDTFFSGQQAITAAWDYLQFPDGVPFGFYAFLEGSPFTPNAYLYHADMGYEFATPGSAAGSVYFYDFASGHWWYSTSTLFPYLYDFTLQAWIYYLPNTQSPGHYTTNPRSFQNMSTNDIFRM